MALVFTPRGHAQFDNGSGDTLLASSAFASGSDVLIFVAGVHYLDGAGDLLADDGGITASPSIGTISRITTATDNGFPNSPKLEIWRAQNVNVGSAVTFTFHYAHDDWAGHYAVAIVQVTGHSANPATVSAIGFSGAATNTFTSPGTGMLPSTGGAGLVALALRSNGSTFSVATAPSGYTLLDSQLDTTSDAPALIVYYDDTISATTSLAPVIVTNESAATGGQIATIYLEASGATATKTIRALARADCLGKTGVMVEVFETEAGYAAGDKLGHYNGQAFSSSADPNGYAVLEVIDASIDADVGDTVVIVAKWVEGDSLEYGIGPGNAEIV